MGEKKRRLTAQPAGQAQSVKKVIARAFEALEAGDRARAAASFETLLASLPADADALNAIGVLGLAARRPAARARAARSRGGLEPARSLDTLPPGDRLPKPRQARARGRGARNGARRSIPRWPKPTRISATSCSSAETMRPPKRASRARSRSCATIRLRCSGSAKRSLRRGARRRHAPTSSARSPSIRRSTRPGTTCRERARRSWRSSNATVPPPPRRRPSWPTPTRRSKASSPRCRSSRENPAYWTQFEHCVKEFDLQHPVDSRVRDLLFRALAHSAVDPARLVRPIVSLIATRPDGVDLRARLTGARDDRRLGVGRCPPSQSVLGDALLQRLLEAVLVPSLFVERLLAFARAALLREISHARSHVPFVGLREQASRCISPIRTAAGGHRGDGAPVFHHRVRVRRNRRRKPAGRAPARGDRGGDGVRHRGAAPLVRACMRAIARSIRSTSRTRSPTLLAPTCAFVARDTTDRGAAGRAASSRNDRRTDRRRRRSVRRGTEPVRGESLPEMAAHRTRCRADLRRAVPA